MILWSIALSGTALLLAPPGGAAPQSVPAASSEFAQPISHVNANGISIAYSMSGPADGRPILLIPGIGMQLIEWPPALVQGLIDEGYRVVTYEPRDTGASTHFSEAGVPDFAALFAALSAGEEPPLPYTADDMTNDVIALLDHLKIEAVDVLGISGGATIGELLSLKAPRMVRSLNLIAANSGNPAVAIPANPDRLAGVPQPAQDETRVAAIARRVAMARALAAPGTEFDEPTMRALMARSVMRDPDPFGAARQGAALLALGDLRSELAQVKAPTLVMHGKEDPLIAPQLGREVSEAIPNAEFMMLENMGHDIPRDRIESIINAVVRNSRRTN